MWEQVNDALRGSTQRVLVAVTDFLPGLLAFILAVVVSCGLGLVLRSAVRRSLRGIGFDQRVARWGLPEVTDWSPSRSPTLLAGKIILWAVILIGVLVGLTALKGDLTSRLVVELFNYVPNLMVALVLLLGGSLLARYLARGVLISAVNMQISSARLLSLGVKWLVLVLTAAMALEHLRIGGDIVKLAFSILFGGIVLALALAVGLGSKEMVSRTWEKQTKESLGETEETFHHL